MPCVTGWLAGRARSHPPHHRLGDSVIPWAPTWTNARHSPHLPPMAPLARAVLQGARGHHWFLALTLGSQHSQADPKGMGEKFQGSRHAST